MKFIELAKKTRSYRRFDEARGIPPGVLQEIVQAAGIAPCAANLQRLRFSIVTEDNERELLCSSIGWAGYLEDWNGPLPGERPSAYMVIHAPDDEAAYTGIDVGIAASYMTLAASDLGIGCCMILSFKPDTVDMIASAEGYRAALLLALGYPGETVVLERDCEEVRYWRSNDGVHHVPKLPHDELILNELK